jgi:Na+/H+-dicarboxylate symporter
MPWVWLLPYGLGALIPLAGIIVGIGEIESARGSAIAGGLVTMFLAWATNDPVTAALCFLVVIVGLLSLL